MIDLHCCSASALLANLAPGCASMVHADPPWRYDSRAGGSGLSGACVYAGATASLAVVCRRLGRGYVGAEIDPERHREAMLRLAQGDLFAEAR